jgi:RHS repeat-associated protein
MEGQTEKAIADVTEALRLNPKSFDALTTRGWIYEASDAWDEAIADFDAAIEVNDKCVSCYEARAVARIRRRDYAGGVADLETALRLNPKDQAAKFEAWSKMPVDSAAVRRGEAQVRQMVHDRPAMAQYGKKAAALYEWAARKFAGEDLGDEITWDASDPNPPFEAQNFGPGGVMRGFIRVRKLGLRPFEKMWCNAVFELYNIANTDRFQQIDGEVIAGTLGREQYVTKMIETESRAAEKTRSFYIHVFLPWAKENHVATDPREWYVASRFNPEENLLLPRAIRERGAYWEFYGRWWDEVSCGRNAGLLQNSCWAALTNSDGSRQFLSGAAVNQVFATDATAGSSSGGICWSLGNNGGVVCDLAANPADVTTEQDRSVHDSFGRVVDQSTSANDPTFTYTGRQCDADAQVCHYAARWYDLKTGHLLSCEPLGFAAADPNLSRYCGDGPTNFTDRSGRYLYQSGGSGGSGGGWNALIPPGYGSAASSPWPAASFLWPEVKKCQIVPARGGGEKRKSNY